MQPLQPDFYGSYCQNTFLYEHLQRVSGQLPPTPLPGGNLPPGQGWGLGQGQGQFQGCGATRQLPPTKIAPRLGLGFGLGLVLGLGGNFPRWQLSQNPYRGLLLNNRSIFWNEVHRPLLSYVLLTSLPSSYETSTNLYIYTCGQTTTIKFSCQRHFPREEPMTHSSHRL